ncbi:minor tail protein [Mycobacterium phage JuicyJay]|nr:minor tail protein [Mycobacterium phage JuicyJay]
MALYRTLYPLTYRSGNTVMHVTKPGVIIDLDRNQAQELSGRVVYVGDLITYPRSGVMYYDSVDSFPLEGDERYIFLARQEGELYGWSYSDGYKLFGAAGQVDEEALAEAVGDVIEDALGDALAGKANVSHTHNPSDVTGLPAAITKLAGIDAGANVTNATNVNAAGAVMNSDTSTADMQFVVDEDNMASNSATKVPTQQSVKAYVDSQVGGGGAAGVNYGISTLRIDTNDVPIADRETYIEATFEIEGITYNGEIRGRGNSTWDFPKKPWRVRLDSAAALLGMPSSRHWALLANYIDRSAARNAIAMQIGSRLSGLDWTPKYRYVEVVLNGTYEGLYQLMEIVRFDPNRVDAEAADDATGLGLTGAYLLEIDSYRDADVVIDTVHDDLPIIMDDPDGSVTEQATYIEDWLNNFETVLYDDDEWLDPETGYKTLIDLDSFVDWYLVNELLVSIDAGFETSVKMYKTRDTIDTPGKLFLGPLWDYDQSMGRAGSTTFSHEGWWLLETTQPASGTPYPGATWIVRMMSDPDFLDAIEVRWPQIVALLDDLEDLVTKTLRHIALGRVNDQVLWPDGGTWSTNASEIVDWLEDRMEWITDNLPALGVSDGEPPSIPEGLDYTATGSTINVTWEASTDNVGVTGYEVRIDGGTPVAKTGLSHTFTDLEPETEYSIDVRAKDAAGNWSDWSEPLVAETGEEGSLPSPISHFDWHEGSGSTTTSIVSSHVLTAAVPSSAWSGTSAAGQFEGDIGDTATPNWTIAVDFTLNAGSSWRNILHTSDAGAADEIYMQCLNLTPNIWTSVGASTGFTFSAITQDEPHQFVLTSDGATQSAYIDGTLVTSRTLTTILEPTNVVVMDSSEPLSGLVHELRFWNVALSAGEVATLASE